MEYRFECGLRLSWQVVGLGIVRELVRNYIRLESQQRFRDQGGGVSVAAHEFRGMPERQVDQGVEDQHLAIAIRAGPDADRGASTSAVIMAATSRGMPSR